jgi:hypothetical protein
LTPDERGVGVDFEYTPPRFFEIFRWIVNPLWTIRPRLGRQYATALARVLERLDHDEPRWWRVLPP